MSPDNIWIIKVIFGCLSGVFGILAAVFTFCETAQNEKYEDTQKWFGAKWEAINRSRWLILPDRAIRWFLQASRKDWLSIIGGPILDRGWTVGTLLFLAPVFLIFACKYYWGGYVAVVVVLLVLLMFMLMPYVKSEVTLLRKKLLVLLFGISVVVVFEGTVIVWTYMLLRLSIYYATPIMLVLFPIYWIMALLPLALLDKTVITIDFKIQEGLILFIFGMTVGFTVTFVALLVGHVADPSAPVPQTLQMLMSNVIFDGLTMVLTFAILLWAVKRGWLFSIPLAVFLDLLMAAVLACCSLYFALVSTEHALSVREVLHILIARSPDGSRVELSPYFWTMHTSFLPTFAYLLLILTTWFGKVILSPVRWFFGKGHEHKSPLKLTAALCTMISVIFGLLFLGAGSAYERAKEKAAIMPQAVVK